MTAPPIPNFAAIAGDQIADALVHMNQLTNGLNAIERGPEERASAIARECKASYGLMLFALMDYLRTLQACTDEARAAANRATAAAGASQ